ncbi:MAG: N-formylglutamate amidohydrolase [Paracoccaceae bacterium]|nr:N-formylglutamate amidohydrolase [Paracoccaceae bacterium]
MTNEPFIIFGAERAARWVVTCDHATNRVPAEIGGGNLGIDGADMARHIAYDVGAAGVAIGVAERLGAPAVLSNFSRLVIDPNRGEDDPTLVMRLYDGTIIPANRSVDAAEVARRRDAYTRPYHRALAETLAARDDPILVAVHSFTPQFRGRAPRPWHVSVLHTDDARLAVPLLARLRGLPGTVVGANEPYSGSLKGDSIDRHATAHGRLNALIEVRNDLIADDTGQDLWAERLAACLDAARADADL